MRFDQNRDHVPEMKDTIFFGSNKVFVEKDIEVSLKRYQTRRAACI